MSVSNWMETFVFNGVLTQESMSRVSGFVVVVHVQNWAIFSLIQAKKKCNMVSFFHVEKLVFVQTNLRMLESVGTNDAIQESNVNDIDITKVPTLPSRLEIEDQHFSLYEKKSSTISMCAIETGI